MKHETMTPRQRLVQMLPGLVFAFCVLQPLLDTATFWQEKLEIGNALTVLLRMGLLCVPAVLGFWLSDRKRYYWITAGILGGFLVCRTAACMQAGYEGAFADLSNMVRIYLLPVTTLYLCTFLRQNPRVKQGLIAGMTANLGIILVIMVLSRLTGTDPYTYPNKQLGVRGWFYFANSQSAILAMIVPVAMGYVLTREKRKILPLLAVTVPGLGALFVFGTRMAVLALAAAGFGMALCLLLADRSRWRQSLAMAAVCVVFFAMLPVSPMVRNQKAVADNLEIKQAAFDRAAAVPEGASGEEQDKALADAYRLFIPGLLDRFGEERVLEAYGRSRDAGQVAGWRRMRLTFCRLLQEDSPESAVWFGMDWSKMTQTSVYQDVLTGEVREKTLWFDPENDFHGIYYLCGGVGLGLMLGFLGFFALRGVLALVRDWKKTFTPEFAGICIGCCCAVVCCVFTASVLRYNSASVYLAMLLAVLWQLSGKKSRNPA